MNKPICSYCKYVKYNTTNGYRIVPYCKLSKKLNPIGHTFYTKCEYKNEGYKCKDFKVSFFVKPFYYKAKKEVTCG